MKDFGYHPGYIGAFTRDQVAGAIPNGSIVHKQNSEAGDATPDGTPGLILGSVWQPRDGVGYFIEWANRPGTAVLVVALKVMRTEGAA